MSALPNCNRRKTGSHSLLLASMLSLVSTVGHAETLRQSTLEFARDPAKVEALKKGIAAMKKNSDADQLSPEFRTSLAYWANIHGYYGNGPHATSAEWRTERFELCKSKLPEIDCPTFYKHLIDITPPDDGIAPDIWGTCTHTPSSLHPGPLNLQFLPWHRMYLYFFERTLARHTGDPNFALPYWDYYAETSPSLNGVVLPAMFYEVDSPLFNHFRTPELNSNRGAIPVNNASASGAFTERDSFPRFSQVLEKNPHGLMHCAVGKGCYIPDIGLVPVAGNDPLFYVHHTNIDRLWQCWLNQKANGQTIDLAWAKTNLGMPDDWYQTSFSFVDENGNKVSMTIADVFTPGKIPVRYTMENNCPTSVAERAAPLAARATGAPERKSLLAPHAPMVLAEQVALSDQTRDIASGTPNQIRRLQGAAMPAPLKTSGGDTYLFLDNVRLKGNPAQTYNVLLSHARTHKAAYIATFSYFGIGDGTHAKHDAHYDPQLLGDFDYKITNQIRELGISSLQDIRVRFEPTDMLVRRDGKKPVFSKDGITINKIRVETRAKPAK